MNDFVRDLVKRCNRCDGTGKLCSICGQSLYICECEGREAEETHECPDCKGAGK